MQAPLATRQLTPQEPIVDGGSVTADHLWTSRPDHGIDLLGPAMSDRSWQGQAGNGLAAAQCVIDWDAKDASCPQGQRSVVWMERPDRHGHPTVRIAFRKPVCGACARRADCPRAATAPRAWRIRERDHDTALQRARERQQTEAFQHTYARRAGSEGTMAQGTRMGALRRSRSSGLVQTRLMHRLLAAAINCRRVAAWFAAIPRARTRPSAFAALAA
jgi:transposase